jgi:drug/metabolite transporter (DMT)-like permease
MKVAVYTSFALISFAFNSILCRLALRGDEADAAGFTAVRLASGTVALVVISYLASAGRDASVNERAEVDGDQDSTLLNSRVSALIRLGSWPSAFFLFAYAVCFSFAYLGLTAGTGALILFGAVQMTMIAAAIFKGERPTPVEWCGLFVAVGGLVYLVLPGLASPPPVSSALMAAAGASWGVYTLRGRNGGDPLANTTGNFVRALPFVVLLALIYLPNLHLSARGIVLAVLSGAVASGVGYTVWYAALKHLTSTRAAILQLAVPVIAAVLGIILLAEAASVRLAIAAALILGGIALTIAGKRR